MHIKTLAATGVKGREFTHILSPTTMFVGSNFSGKTARIEAIRFAFLGHIPEVGKQAFATWGLITGTVELTFDPVGVLSRTIKKVGDTVKIDAANTIGLDLTKPMPFLNAEEYFGLTEQERIQYVFRTIKVPASYTVEGIVADLRNLSFEENTEATEKAKNTIIATVERVFGGEAGVSAGLVSLTKDKGVLKNEFSFENKRAKDTLGAVRTLAELKFAAGDVSADTLASVNLQLGQVATKLQNANQVVGSLSNRAMQANQVELRRRQLEETLAGEVPDRTEEIDKLEKQIIAIAVPDITRDKVTASYEAHQAAEAALTRASERRDGILSQIADVEDKITEIKGHKSCPLCKAAGKNWKTAVTREYKLNLEALKKDLTAAEDDVRKLSQDSKKRKTSHAAAADSWERKAEAELRIRETEQRILTIRASVREIETAREHAGNEHANLQKITAPTDGEMGAAAAEVQTLTQEKTALEGRRDTIVRLQHDLLRAEEAAAEHLMAATKAAVIKKVGETLRDRQADMIKDLFGSLLETANYFTAGIMNDRLIFHEGEIGYARDGRFVSHKAFSGTEKALTYIAIAAALSKDAPIRLVLLDEMGRLDVRNKVLVMERLRAAVKEKIIDQVIAVDTAIPANAPKDWGFITVTQNK